jgi:hypothetical protein
MATSDPYPAGRLTKRTFFWCCFGVGVAGTAFWVLGIAFEHAFDVDRHPLRLLTAVAGLPVNALSLVAAVIDSLVTSTALQGGVRELRPAFPRVLHPFATVKRAALGRTAALRVR